MRRFKILSHGGVERIICGLKTYGGDSALPLNLLSGGNNMSDYEEKRYYLSEIIGKREANKIKKKALEKMTKELKLYPDEVKTSDVYDDIKVVIIH